LFLNFKGGTGKTSISVSYAYCLAELGYSVLLVDLDSQGHAAKCLGVDAEQCKMTLYEILVKKVDTNEVIIQYPLKGLYLIPSNLRMSTIDLALMPMTAREYKLKRVFEKMENHYDFIILDAPPSFGLLNLNALIASTELFVPVLADFLSFHGLKLLFDTISGLEQDLQLMLDQIYIFINHYNPTTIISRQARESLEKHYSEYLINTVIRQCTKFAQSSAEGIPITLFDPTCKAAEDIVKLIEEIFKHTSTGQYKEVS
jgi:chromosome partitioning protein